MTVAATVLVWHEAEGWGVIDSRETPGGCWAHFSHIVTQGAHSLRPGQPVHLDWVAGEQDGYHFRATSVYPADETPADVRPTGTHQTPGYHSTLELTFDDPDVPG